MHMPTITIPSNINAKEQLIAVPKRTYEEFLVWQKKIKSAKTFKPTKSELRALARARKEFENGNFVPWQELKHELANLRSQSRTKAT